MRVSPPKVFPEATLAPRPAAGTPGADAHRQATFVLGRELEAVLAGLNLEGGIVAMSGGARYRNQAVASGMMAWSGSWLARLGALHSVQEGNAPAALALAREGAARADDLLVTLATNADGWTAWVQAGGVRQASEQHATGLRAGGERVAQPELEAIHAAAATLAGPSFAARLLLAGSDSTPERILATFGDRDFHLGLAELVLGVLLETGGVLLGEVSASEIFAVPDRGLVAQWQAEAAAIAGRSDRCRLEALGGGAEGFLVHNWRRTSGAAPKRFWLEP